MRRFERDVLGSLVRSTEIEWLLPDGLGGYASGTLAGVCTRRYHGLFVANVAGQGRRHLVKTLEFALSDGVQTVELATHAYPGVVHPEGYRSARAAEVSGEEVFVDFETLGRVVRRTYRWTRTGLEVGFVLLDGTPAELAVAPLLTGRDHHAEIARHDGVAVAASPGRIEVDLGEDRLSVEHPGWSFESDPDWYYRFDHEIERERGLFDREDAYRPGWFRMHLTKGVPVRLVFSAGIEHDLPVPGHEAGFYRVRLDGRPALLAGYPWFTDWGRDTMISLPGVCRATASPDWGREVVAGYLDHVENGLIPNRFHEDGRGTDRNTADATLWMFETISRLDAQKPSDNFLRKWIERLDDVLDAHLSGRAGLIQIDADGLPTQGGPGLQATWMDAKIRDWVVTPRTGKAVEIAALWINALDRTDEWRRRIHLPPRYREESTRAKASFARFWNEEAGCLFDVLDPDAASVRPNQAIALSLDACPIPTEQAVAALARIEADLLTPCGLRTLSPDDPAYRGRYEGSMDERDAGYHQGTVWPWFLGPYVRACLRYGLIAQARRALRNAAALRNDSGVLGISEVYDGDAPHRSSGCPWQAWSVAEVYEASRLMGAARAARPSE